MISVIMPAYNSEMYISEAIESVINQSYKNFELIIVDDGSTDRTPEIIDKYAETDLRIKAFHRENAGVSSARNFALQNICGEYVTFIDSDVMYHTDRLKIMYSVFEQNPECDSVFVDFKEFKGDISINDTVGLSKRSL